MSEKLNKEMQTDNELVRRIQKNDQLAFRMLVKRYDQKVLQLVYSYTKNEDDAKDIYQEVFIRVYKGLKDFQFRSEFSTWLFRITANVCISFKGRKKYKNTGSLDIEIGNEDSGSKLSDIIASDSITDNGILSSEIGLKVNQAVETLPAKQKLAFTLKFYEGYKIKEIAKMMNCKDGTIKRYLFTATNKLKTLLNNYYND